jgi:hypothetical protein
MGSLLINREDDGMGWWIDIEAYNIAQLVDKLRVGGETMYFFLVPRFGSGAYKAVGRDQTPALRFQPSRQRGQSSLASSDSIHQRDGPGSASWLNAMAAMTKPPKRPPMRKPMLSPAINVTAS